MDAGIEDTVAASTHDIGVGGAFIETETPLPVGTALDLEIDLGPGGASDGDGDTVALTGEVRWVAEPGRAPGAHPSGMGVKFGPLDVDVLLALSDYFAELAQSGGRAGPWRSRALSRARARALAAGVLFAATLLVASTGAGAGAGAGEAASISPAVAAQLGRLIGQRVAVAADGRSLRILDIAGEGAPVVGVVERRGAHLWLRAAGGTSARRLGGPLAVPRIAGPGYTVWVVGRVAADGSLVARRIGILSRPGGATAAAPGPQGPVATTK